MNVSTDGNPELDQGGIELLPSYESMKRGSNRVAVALFNNSQGKVMLRKGTVVARISAANVIPPMLAPSAEMYQDIPDLHDGNWEYDAESRYIPEMMEDIPPKLEPTPERLDSLFEKLDLTGISEWPEYEQNEVCELI